MKALVVAAAALGTTPAAAELVDIYGTSIEVSAPPGFCAFDVMRPAEAEIIRGIEQETGGRSALVTAFASCQDLLEMRAGQGTALARMGQIFVGPRSSLPTDLEPGRKAYLERASKDFKSVTSAELPSAIAEFQENNKGAAAAVVGTIGRDENAVYSVLVAGTKDKPIAGVIGITLIEGLPANLTIYGNYVGPETFDALLSDVRSGIANLLTNNGAIDTDSGLPIGFGHLSLPTIIIGAGVLIFAIGLVVMLVGRLRRKPESSAEAAATEPASTDS